MIPFFCKSCRKQIGVQSERELVLALCAEDLDGSTYPVGSVTFFAHATFRHRTASGKCGAANHWQPIPRAATSGQAAAAGDFG